MARSEDRSDKSHGFIGIKQKEKHRCNTKSSDVQTIMRGIKSNIVIIGLLVLTACARYYGSGPMSGSRIDQSLDLNWHTKVFDSIPPDYSQQGVDTSNWQSVNVPHNWDSYEGYRRLKHGNRHGYAWYRKKFHIRAGHQSGKRHFLWFEGVGSYATVWVNGKKAGYHAGGRTSFTLDVTGLLDTVKNNNILAVRVDHPVGIQNLPWVCGGCSDEVGFSEGSQPMGIFRPVHLITTNDVRIEPFGVHIWNDTTVSEKSAVLHLTTEVKNYSPRDRKIDVVSYLTDSEGRRIQERKESVSVPTGAMLTIPQTFAVAEPRLWSLEDPYLYTVVTELWEKKTRLDVESTTYGIRHIRWPIGHPSANGRFFLNGKPVFINGIAEYEHQMGQSHAFSAEQIRARVLQMKAAGFNAFRDAHQPHNLRYQHNWDSLGMLWWTQMAAHVWYDTPEFRENFKTLLTEWVRERRNSPSLVLWGLENESKLPADFARECTGLIRSLDPTTSSQRLVTTCNGGEGTDWDVPQNWTGTYGGNPQTYAQDIQKQILIGEYGAWRSLDLHTEGTFTANGPLSEDRMTELMETKIRLAESVKDKCSGQFHWLFTSHENPGRVQGGEGVRDQDRVGPINYKGLFTAWSEPTDAWYMFRANYAPKTSEPMVYIVSHTWPQRWTSPGKKDNIRIYSNCDEVELFNDVRNVSLGRKTNPGRGLHFQWDGADIAYNVLYAVGYVNGKAVAHDIVTLYNLPEAPHLKDLSDSKEVIKAQPDLQYLYRVNCGGPDYTDHEGNTWNADRPLAGTNHWGSVSWTNGFEGLPPAYASQRRTTDPVGGTQNEALFQTFRYGNKKLAYTFPVPNGTYQVELYFSEPWYGIGGGLNCTGWRMFDVAVNDGVLSDLDIWKEAGQGQALRKVITAQSKDGRIVISFPEVAAGQAIISAIAIASKTPVTAAPASPALPHNLSSASTTAIKDWSVQAWLDIGTPLYSNRPDRIQALPPVLYSADWIRTTDLPATTDNQGHLASFTVTADADVYILLDARIKNNPEWLAGYEASGGEVVTYGNREHRYTVLRKRFRKGTTVTLGDNGHLPDHDEKMYSIAVCAATLLEPAVDLRRATQYTAAQAIFRSIGMVRDTVYGKNCISFIQAAKGQVEWKVSVGVGDKYTLRCRYVNHSGKAVSARITMTSADGVVMNEEAVLLNPTPPGKWKMAESSSGSMINAGVYKVTVSIEGQKSVSIRDLDVQ